MHYEVTFLVMLGLRHVLVNRLNEYSYTGENKFHLLKRQPQIKSRQRKLQQKRRHRKKQLWLYLGLIGQEISHALIESCSYQWWWHQSSLTHKVTTPSGCMEIENRNKEESKASISFAAYCRQVEWYIAFAHHCSTVTVTCPFWILLAYELTITLCDWQRVLQW